MANKKQGDILKELRLEIVSGKLTPGARLPTRSELQCRFHASNQTIQMAMNSLLRDGFVNASRLEGTMVAEKPPHLCHYGMVSHIPFSGNRFTSTMQHAAMKMEEEGDCSFTYYCTEEGRVNSEGYKRLLSDVESYRVAGLIFITPPYFLADTPALLQPGLPRVMNCQREKPRNIPSVDFGHILFLEKSVDHLVRIGRRKIALIAGYLCREYMEYDIAYLMKRKVSQPLLTQNCSPSSPWSAHQAAMVLMGLSGKDRPDAVIIKDDHLLEPASEGLLKSKVRIPDDVTVVSLANFPEKAPSHVPITFLGLDCEYMLRCDIECLKAQREGRKFSQNAVIAPLFESELVSERLWLERSLRNETR